jgi:hypothetical protein
MCYIQATRVRVQHNMGWLAVRLPRLVRCLILDCQCTQDGRDQAAGEGMYHADHCARTGWSDDAALERQKWWVAVTRLSEEVSAFCLGEVEPKAFCPASDLHSARVHWKRTRARAHSR